MTLAVIYLKRLPKVNYITLLNNIDMLFFPPNIDINSTSTQLSNKREYADAFSVTKLKSKNDLDDGDLFSLPIFLKNRSATQINIEDSNSDSSSTWQDLLEEDLDVISKLVFKKSFKVKAKIIAISNYTPKIVIE